MASEQPERKDSSRKQREQDDGLERAVHQKERRKLHARSQGAPDLWFGLGYFGLVGWAVAIPTVLGVFLGLWLDANLDSQRSWTLTLLLAGLVLGLLNAWFWVERQRKAIDEERESMNSREDMNTKEDE